MKKIPFLLISFIPLCMQIPYLLSAWRSSRLDQWDWLFFILSACAAVYACRKEKTDKCDWTSLFLLTPTLFLALTPHYHKVNAIAAASSMAVIFATVWLLFSWRFASRILPAAVILLMGTPSSSYAVSLILMCPVWMSWTVKLLVSALCFVWIFCNKRFAWQLKKGSLCFTAALLSSGFLLLHSKELYFEGRSFVPEFSGHVGRYWGRSIEPDENTKRFFVSGTVKQYRYTADDTDISVLAVKCGSDIHEIHPASHCLRTSFWTIHSEKTLYLQNDFAVTEVDAQKGKKRYLLWVWYSSDKFSTPGFLGFRKHFRNGENRYTYQISTRISKDSDTAGKVLKDFIQSLKHNSNSVNRKMKL